jgi:fructoselysine-6-P-deglycase FrlB-like protein
MSHLETLVERAKTSELFTSPRLADDLRRFLATSGDRIRELARDAHARGVRTVYFAGGGGSWSAMYLGKYLADRFTTLTTDAILSYDLIWRSPRRLGPDALVFCASYSGGTEDTLLALRHAKAAGARTVAVVNRADTVIGREADETIAYGATALYALPMAAVSLFALEWARIEGNGEADAVLDGFDALPELIASAYRDSQARGEEMAAEMLPAQLLYCLGSGPLYGLAYKFALTVFMENIRTNGAFIEAAEFRHGPAEALERQRPEMAFLLGTDESRPMVERSLEVARSRGARVITFDAADHAGLHPLLAPFVMKVPLQWFVVYSALMRGIDDLDARVLMGKRILATGEATWP